MHFGEVEHTPTIRRMRPDCNGQWASMAVCAPKEDDLPIFVDLDVMRDVLSHAHSDRRVELGGVLLGGQFEDEFGQPFVLVSDCLRARHYESTKGSFKFTHDTWEQITREREQLPSDVQMVGWYHTHPDWGVFLSGLDMFICDNFFNKPLDVALVIDPCRLDTGFFQWTPRSDERIRRTGGYYLFASRFRTNELRNFVTELEGSIMPESVRSPQAPIMVHSPPPPPPPAWQALAVFAMLSLQFCLLVLLAVRLLPAPTDEPKAAVREIASLKESVDQLNSVRQREADIDAKLQVLEMIVHQKGDAPDGVVKTLAERTGEVEELRASLRGQQSLARELDTKLKGLEFAIAEVRRSEQKSRGEVVTLNGKVASLQEELQEARDRLSGERPEAKVADTEVSESWWSAWLADGKSLGFGAFLGAAIVGGTLYVVMRRQNQSADNLEPNPAQ